MTSRLAVTGLLCWALAGTAYAVLWLTFGERPVSIHVRWAPTIDDAARLQLEQRYQLARAELTEDRTFAYALTDRSRDNIRSLVLDPAVEDTHEIDRTAFRVGDAAPRLPYVTPAPGIPVGLEFMSVLGFLGGLASIGLGLLERAAPGAAKKTITQLMLIRLTPNGPLCSVVDDGAADLPANTGGVSGTLCRRGRVSDLPRGVAVA